MRNRGPFTIAALDNLLKSGYELAGEFGTAAEAAPIAAQARQQSLDVLVYQTEHGTTRVYTGPLRTPH